MMISKNIVKAFLLTFLVVILANGVTPFFGVWNFYLGSLLLIFVVLSILLFLRKHNPPVAKVVSFVLGSAIVAVILIFAVFFTISLLTSNNATHLYDIGGKTDSNVSYLYPMDRVSNSSILNETNATYRNITSYLVYFKVPAEYSSGIVNVSLSIKENLPFGSIISIRGKNSTNWTYVENLAYVSLGKNNASNWKTISVSFNASDLLVEDDQYIFAIYSAQLANPSTKLNYISLDWIKISEDKN